MNTRTNSKLKNCLATLNAPNASNPQNASKPQNAPKHYRFDDEIIFKFKGIKLIKPIEFTYQYIINVIIEYINNELIIIQYLYALEQIFKSINLGILHIINAVRKNCFDIKRLINLNDIINAEIHESNNIININYLIDEFLKHCESTNTELTKNIDIVKLMIELFKIFTEFTSKDANFNLKDIEYTFNNFENIQGKNGCYLNLFVQKFLKYQELLNSFNKYVNTHFLSDETYKVRLKLLNTRILKIKDDYIKLQHILNETKLIPMINMNDIEELINEELARILKKHGERYTEQNRDINAPKLVDEYKILLNHYNKLSYDQKQLLNYEHIDSTENKYNNSHYNIKQYVVFKIS
jgi:hypothetical protein